MKHTDWLVSKQKGHFILFFSPPFFIGGPYISSGSLEELPTFPLCIPHSGCYYHAVMLIGCSLCDPSEQQLLHSITGSALNYCHWLSITKRWQVVRNSGRKVARAKRKIIKILYWKGAESRSVNRLAKRDAGAWGHEAQGSKSS